MKSIKSLDYNLECSSNNKAISYCLNKQCQQSNSFICGNYECKCNQEHQTCLTRGMIQTTYKKIVNKKQKSKQLLQSLTKKISQTFNEIIDKVSDFQNKLIEDVQKIIKTVQISKEESLFQKLIEGQQITQFKNNKDLFIRLWQQITGQDPITKHQPNFNKIIEQIQKFKSQIQTNIQLNLLTFTKQKQIITKPKQSNKISQQKLIHPFLHPEQYFTQDTNYINSLSRKMEQFLKKGTPVAILSKSSKKFVSGGNDERMVTMSNENPLFYQELQWKIVKLEGERIALRNVLDDLYLDGRSYNNQEVCLTHKLPQNTINAQWILIPTGEQDWFILQSASSKCYLDGRSFQKQALVTNRPWKNDHYFYFRFILI